MGLEESRSEAHRHLDAAMASLEQFGKSAEGLRSLANFVVHRGH